MKRASPWVAAVVISTACWGRRHRRAEGAVQGGLGRHPQLETLRGERLKLHQQLQQALAAATIDPAKVETLRRQSVQLMDKASAVTTQAFVTSAQVLTPEQRQKVASALEQRRARGPQRKAE